MSRYPSENTGCVVLPFNVSTIEEEKLVHLLKKARKKAITLACGYTTLTLGLISTPILAYFYFAHQRVKVLQDFDNELIPGTFNSTCEGNYHLTEGTNDISCYQGRLISNLTITFCGNLGELFCQETKNTEIAGVIAFITGIITLGTLAGFIFPSPYKGYAKDIRRGHCRVRDRLNTEDLAMATNVLTRMGLWKLPPVSALEKKTSTDEKNLICEETDVCTALSIVADTIQSTDESKTCCLALA